MKQWARLIVGSVIIFHLRLFTAITKRPRVRVLVINEKEQVLLIRTFVSHGNWTLPGGGMKRAEAPVAAARRELLEEVGIGVEEADFEHLVTLTKPKNAVPFTAPVFRARVKSGALTKNGINPHEVAKADWFDMDSLPSSLSQITHLAIEAHKNDRGNALRV